jgi:hypothetical protein
MSKKILKEANGKRIEYLPYTGTVRIMYGFNQRTQYILFKSSE